MKKLTIILLLSLSASLGFASKLSHFLNKMETEQRQRDAVEWQQDMNFADFAFRLLQRYTDDHGQRCREYEFRARSNPYRHGHFTVCDDR